VNETPAPIKVESVPTPAVVHVTAPDPPAPITAAAQPILNPTPDASIIPPPPPPDPLSCPPPPPPATNKTVAPSITIGINVGHVPCFLLLNCALSGHDPLALFNSFTITIPEPPVEPPLNALPEPPPPPPVFILPDTP
jgi:hypothetical protein